MIDSMTTGTLALIILAVIVIQIAVAILFKHYRRKQQYQSINDNKNSIVTHSLDKRGSSDLSWQGYKEFIVQRRELEDVNNSICSFYLVPTDDNPLATFKPGQFLTFKLQIEDPDTHKLKSVVRCYSLSDTPRPDYYRVSIKRIPSPFEQPDVPAGVSSNFFHDYVQEGSRLLVKAPSGHFHLMEEEPLPIVLIGGGIGITPMLSILNTIITNEINREVWLYYGIRNSDEYIMKNHLQTLANTHENFHLQVCYSAPSKNDVKGIDYQHDGRVSIPLLRDTLKLKRYQFYVCGPKPMMESIVPGLEDWGVDSKDIYYESFGPATLIKHEKKSLPGNSQAITVTFSRSGKSIPWDTAADSLLEFAEANDIEVDSGCRAGSCGSCQTAVKSGEVDYNQEADADVAPGHCLLCISTPKNDLTLDA